MLVTLEKTMKARLANKFFCGLIFALALGVTSSLFAFDGDTTYVIQERHNELGTILVDGQWLRLSEQLEVESLAPEPRRNRGLVAGTRIRFTTTETRGGKVIDHIVIVEHAR